jgi:hypothetical protein
MLSIGVHETSHFIDTSCHCSPLCHFQRLWYGEALQLFTKPTWYLKNVDTSTKSSIQKAQAVIYTRQNDLAGSQPATPAQSSKSYLFAPSPSSPLSMRRAKLMLLASTDPLLPDCSYHALRKGLANRPCTLHITLALHLLGPPNRSVHQPSQTPLLPRRLPMPT